MQVDMKHICVPCTLWAPELAKIKLLAITDKPPMTQWLSKWQLYFWIT